MQNYVCQQPINYDRRYNPGELIQLDEGSQETANLLSKGYIAFVVEDPAVPTVEPAPDEEVDPEPEEEVEPVTSPKKRRPRKSTAEE